MARLESALKTLTLDSSEAARLSGTICAITYATVGRFGKAHLGPIWTRCYADHATTFKEGDQLHGALSFWWKNIATLVQPISKIAVAWVPRVIPRKRNTLFVDASNTHGGFTFYYGDADSEFKKRPRVGSFPIGIVAEAHPDESHIKEGFSLLQTICALVPWMRGRFSLVCIDNTGLLGACIKGSSTSSRVLNALVGVMNLVLTRLNAGVYFLYCPTNYNLGDPPSRPDEKFYPIFLKAFKALLVDVPISVDIWPAFAEVVDMGEIASNILKNMDL